MIPIVAIIDRIPRPGAISKVSITVRNYQFHKRLNDPSYLPAALSRVYARPSTARTAIRAW